MLAQQDAESIVKDGLKVATASPAVAQAAAEAHNAYQAKKDALDKATGELDAARAAYEEASERADATEQELAGKLADLAMAQDAYDRLAKQMGWDVEEAPVKQAAVKTTAKPAAKADALAQTGDPAAVVAAGMAIAGAAAVVGGAHFRRRRSE